MKKYLFLIGSLILIFLFKAGIVGNFQNTAQGVFLFVGILIFITKTGYHFSYGENSYGKNEMRYGPLFFMFTGLGTLNWDSGNFFIEIFQYSSLYFVICTFLIVCLSKKLSPRKFYEKKIEGRKGY
jgi:hypothetical protein